MPPELIEARALPRGLDSRSLRRSVLQIAAVLVIVCVVAALAPGLGAVRQRLPGAGPGGLVVALVLELLSCLSYFIMFRPIFLRADVTAHELPTGQVRVGGRLAAAGERSGRPRLRCLGAAQGWHAGPGHRSPHGGVLRTQERGELRRQALRPLRDPGEPQPATARFRTGCNALSEPLCRVPNLRTTC